MSEENQDWLDFKSIKARVQVRPVLEHFGILEHLEERGAELVGWCPLGREHGKADSFAFNVEKRSFQCFACKARGSVLDFIAKHQDIGLRDAAKIALGLLGENPEALEGKPEAAKGRPYGKPARPETSKPEARRGTERQKPEKQENPIGEETGGLPFFGWTHARFLVESGMLDPERLVVLDVAALETFLKVTAKGSEETA